MISHLHVITDLFAANPLAQSVGLFAFVIGISAFIQRSDQRLRTFLTLYCIVIGCHFFLLGSPAAAYAAWLSGLRSFISTRTRHVAVMCFFLLIVWVLGVPHITQPIQWLTIIGTTVGTWALYREQGLRMRLLLLTGTICWVTHNVVIGSIGGSLIEGSFLFVNSHTIFRLWRQQMA
ncbi:YgjV family protein [Tolumonas lignilytica]|uniref:YgjV family protein n=1 Tax=Tolumonas lignilytica TaxID=1283284 RepID=UPI001F42994C|nr:YgjV family protein [Tolumonas lignilytica]